MTRASHFTYICILESLVGCIEPLGPDDGVVGVGHASGGRPGLSGFGGSQVVPIASGGRVTTTTTGCGTGARPGAGGASAVCSSSTNLIANALAAPPDWNWIGGDPASSADNPCGVQGGIYTYSDTGLDATSGTADDTLSTPAVVPGATYPENRQSPCSGGKCCISGRTSLWPMGTGGMVDYTANVWGAGLGIALNSDGVTKFAYNGPARGFVIRTSGTLNGQVVRLLYTQSLANDVAPFVEVVALGTRAILFTDVTCPIWGTNCLLPSSHPFDLQLQIVGGDVAGDFTVCIDSITPIL